MTSVTHGEREQHYRKQLGVYDLPMGQRAPLADLAWQMATAEMLDEIHEMLRTLTVDTSTPVGSSIPWDKPGLKRNQIVVTGLPGTWRWLDWPEPRAERIA